MQQLSLKHLNVSAVKRLHRRLITFRTERYLNRALLHLGPNVITFRTLLHLGQLSHLGLQHPCR